MSTTDRDDAFPFPRDVIEAYAAGELQDETLAAQIESNTEVMREVVRIQEENDFLTRLAGAWSTMPGSTSAGPPRQRIEGYRIISEVFRGGQGVVYKGLQENTKRIVAIKVMLGGALASERARQRFEREVELVASLRHRNIVTVHDSGQLEDGSSFFVMNSSRCRCRAGPHLRTPAPRGSAGLVPTRIRQFIDICDAIQYAHQRGIIHRDLKPGNIMVDRSGTPAPDFGVAKCWGCRLRSKRPWGSSWGRSPTHPRAGQGRYGCHRYPQRCLRAGADPLRAAHGRASLSGPGFRLRHHPEHHRGRARALTAEPGIKRICGDRPQVDREGPDRRYQSAAAFAQDLQNYLDGEPVEALRDNASYVLSKVVDATGHRSSWGP